MSINLGYHVTRYTFFPFNVIFWFLGWGCLGVGVWLYLAKTDFQSLTPPSHSLLSAAGLFVAAGLTVVVIGFVGCAGAWVESKCLLLTYFVFVLVVLVVMTTSAVLGFLYQEEMTESVRVQLYHSLTSNHNASETPVWDRLQSQLSCCGVDNYNDWLHYLNPEASWVPDSCCKTPSSNCGKSRDPALWHQQGCYKAFSAWFLEHMHIVGILGLLVGVVQVFGMVASAILYCEIRERKSRHWKYKYYPPG